MLPPECVSAPVPVSNVWWSLIEAIKINKLLTSRSELTGRAKRYIDSRRHDAHSSGMDFHRCIGPSGVCKHHKPFASRHDESKPRFAQDHFRVRALSSNEDGGERWCGDSFV